MATMTRTDISNDVNMLLQNLEDKHRPLVSPIAALKLSMTWPIACVMGYVMALLWMAFNFTPDQDLFGNSVGFTQKLEGEISFTAFLIVMALGVGASLYNSALVYLSFDEGTRNSSLIINRIKRLISRLAIGALVLNWTFALMSVLFRPEFIMFGGAFFVASIIVIQIIVSSELTRYGIAGAMNKFARLVKKI